MVTYKNGSPLYVMISPGPSETNKWYFNQPDIKNPPLARVINLDKLITPLWILEKKRHFRRFSIKYPDLDFKQEAHPKPPLYHENEPKKIWPTQLTRTKSRRSLYNWSETPGHILSSHFARDQYNASAVDKGCSHLALSQEASKKTVLSDKYMYLDTATSNKDLVMWH